MAELKLNSKEYTFEFFESWDGGPAPVLIPGDVPQAIAGKRSAYNEGGGNLWPYILRVVGEDIDFPADYIDLAFGSALWTQGASDWACTPPSATFNNSNILGLSPAPALINPGELISVAVTFSLVSFSKLFFGLTAQRQSDTFWSSVAAGNLDPPTTLTPTINLNFTAGEIFTNLGITAGQESGGPELITVTNIVWTFGVPGILGKILTRYINPLFWRGWARPVSVIIDTNFVSRTGTNQVIINATEADINKGEIGNPLTIQIPGDDPILGTVNIPPGVTAPNAAFKKVSAFRLDGTTLLADPIFYKLLDECTNPVYLQWISALGGPESHLFKRNQDFTETATPGTVGESPISWDLGQENQRTKFRIGQESNEILLLTAENILLDQLLALNEIKESDNVNLYLDKLGTELLPVIVVDTFETEYKTDEVHYDFTVMVELPEGVKFNDVKLY